MLSRFRWSPPKSAKNNHRSETGVGICDSPSWTIYKTVNNTGESCDSGAVRCCKAKRAALQPVGNLITVTNCVLQGL